MTWPDGERYLRPPQSLVVSLLLSLVSTLVFSRTRGVLSHQSILTHFYISSKYIENASCSACGHSSQDTSHLILHCPATESFFAAHFYGDSLSLYDLWPEPGELPSFWGYMVFRHAPIPRKGPGKQQQHANDDGERYLVFVEFK